MAFKNQNLITFNIGIMTTRVSNFKMAICTVFILLIVQFGVSAEELNNSPQEDTVKYLKFSGKVIDKETQKAIPFASIFKKGTSIGTVSNLDGEFELKIQGTSKEGSIGVSYIGYKSYISPITSLKENGNIVRLEPSPIPLKEVVIRTKDPLDLINGAVKNIPENYSTDPFMLTSFYRESIKQNRNYVSVSEGILDVYKSSYNNDVDIDRIKVFKGRKSMDVKKMDTVIVKLQGGPTTSFLLDIVKNPSALLEKDFMKFYTYEFGGLIEINDRQTYVISFEQRDNVEYPLYSGKLYLDAENLAFAAMEFRLSEKGIDRAVSAMVKKRPATMKIDITGSNYLISYREMDGKWYFNYVRSELMFKCRWKKKLFRSNYNIAMEMAITDRDMQNVDKYKIKETIKKSEIFAENAEYFVDGDFWGSYNTILPDESIEAAISKLSKKLIKANREEE